MRITFGSKILNDQAEGWTIDESLAICLRGKKS